MKGRFLRWILITLTAMPFCGVEAGERPKRLLFLGNSITLHGPAPDIGWTGNYGMAASSEDKDYVHLVRDGLAGPDGVRPEIRTRNIADFERGSGLYDAPRILENELSWGADHVVLAIGENIPDPSAPDAQKQLREALDRLLKTIADHGHPAVIVRSCFWPHPVKDRILREAAAAAGAAFVDISPLGSNPENAARSERRIDHPGVAGHPGDRGMKAIAEALLSAIRQMTSGAVILKGEEDSGRAPHGLGNIYAPEIARDGQRWLMWYGGQGRDGHDRIHMAESADGFSWTRRGVVIDCGAANHVNDPSVVRSGDRWWMFYTVAPQGEQDEIAAATSVDGITWELKGTVLPREQGNAWDSAKAGRPSVLLEGGLFRMWYDGQPSPEAAAASAQAAAVRQSGRAVGYAESRDGLTWQRRPNPVLPGAGAVHVSRQRDRLIMLIESGSGIDWASSADGLTWNSAGLLLPLSGDAVDRFGRVTPCLVSFPGRTAVFSGAASRQSWDGNAIFVSPVAIPGAR